MKKGMRTAFFAVSHAFYRLTLAGGTHALFHADSLPQNGGIVKCRSPVLAVLWSSKCVNTAGSGHFSALSHQDGGGEGPQARQQRPFHLPANMQRLFSCYHPFYFYYENILAGGHSKATRLERQARNEAYVRRKAPLHLAASQEPGDVLGSF